MTLESIIRTSAVGCGLLVLLIPLIKIYRQRERFNAPGQKRRPGSLRIPGIFTLAALYFIGVILLWKPITNAIGEPVSWLLLLLGSVLYFPGIGLYLWGLFSLGEMFAVSSSRAAMLYLDHELIESGPYKYLRHPMYLGVILAALGATLIFRTWAMILFCLTAISVVFRARREEELLRERFDGEWEDYRGRVPAWQPRLRDPDPSAQHSHVDEQEPS